MYPTERYYNFEERAIGGPPWRARYQEWETQRGDR
jgi:hypothetical protein